jgi:putative transcriptional regulator
MSPELDNRIRVFRAERRMSQAELAEAIGVSRKTISTIEVGRFVPSTVIALRIAQFFGVPVEEIFSLNDPRAPGH